MCSSWAAQEGWGRATSSLCRACGCGFVLRGPTHSRCCERVGVRRGAMQEERGQDTAGQDTQCGNGVFPSLNTHEAQLVCGARSVHGGRVR